MATEYDYKVKIGDTGRILDLTINDDDEEFDLSDAESVELVLVNRSTRTRYTFDLEFEDDGTATLDWSDHDFPPAGDYIAEYVITRESGVVDKVPSEEWLNVRFVAAI